MAQGQNGESALGPNSEPAVPIATADQVGQIRDSFDAIWPAHRAIAEAFYARFFELAPRMRDACSLMKWRSRSVS